MTRINQRLDLIKEKILDDSFIKGKGLGNEISFYIFDYDPRHELKVRDHVAYLKGQLASIQYNRRIIEFDLYDIFIELTKGKNIFDQIFKMEEDMDNEYVYRALTTFAKPEIFLDKIKSELGDNNVIFLTGIGKIYPILRSHNILNNLQEVLENDTPVVLFFPGEYDEQSLRLFNTIDANYYRAFRLVD